MELRLVKKSLLTLFEKLQLLLLCRLHGYADLDELFFGGTQIKTKWRYAKTESWSFSLKKLVIIV